MMKKVLIFVLLSCVALYGKTFSLEALYGINHMRDKHSGSEAKGWVQDIGLRTIFFSDQFAHEILGRYSGFSKMKTETNPGVKDKFEAWEAEYRFGYRMDSDMSALGMLSGSAYLGAGYQNIIKSKHGKRSYIYMPFGFWGEDYSGVDWLKVRYGLNFKMMFFNKESSKSFKFDFGLGGKVYTGVGFSLGNAMDMFVQVAFKYNEPYSKLITYGLEAGVQF